MDLDKALVSAVLAEGVESLTYAKERGVNLDRVFGEGNNALKFVLDFFDQYKTLPSAAMVFGKTGIQLEPPQGPAAFFSDEVVNRSLYSDLKTGASEFVDSLESRDPIKAREVLLALAQKTRGHDAVAQKASSVPALYPGVLAYYDLIKSGKRGILTPWDTLNDNTLGFWPGEVVLFVARTGVGKCLNAGEMVQDPVTGLSHTIEELVLSRDLKRATTWSQAGGVHSAEITAKHDTGRKECLRVVLASGREVVVTPEHPFLSPDAGWVRADSLCSGATIGIPARMPLPEQPVDLPPHVADFLALMLADGACTARSTPRFTKKDTSIVDVGRRVAAAFGLQLISGNKGRDWSFSHGRGARARNPAQDVLVEHGLAGCLSKNKIMPEAVFRLGSDQLSRFLSLFWMCDGYVDGSGVCLGLASEKLVRSIQHLLLRFGIQSSVDYKLAKNQTGEFDSWRLRVYSHCLEAFEKHVPLWGDKGARLQAHRAKDRNANLGFPRVSHAEMIRIKAMAGPYERHSATPARGDALRRVAARLGRKNFSPKDLFKKHGDLYAVSLAGLEAFGAEFGCLADLQWLWDSELYWDTIESIESVGEKKIYDLTMAPTSCFVANDVLVHNTWTTVILAAHAFLKDKRRVLYGTTEVSKERIAMRFAAYQFRIPYDDLRKARLGAVQEQAFRDAVAKCVTDDGLFVIGGDFDFKPESLEAAIEERRPEMVVMDGAYLLKMAGKDRTDQAANAFNELKRMAVRQNVVIVVTTQFNRDVKVNTASSVRTESIALTDVAAWNADTIIGLVQTDDMKNDRRMIFKTLKSREGLGTEFELNWDFFNMNFDELTKGGSGAPGGALGLAGPPAPDPFGSGLFAGTGGGGQQVALPAEEHPF